ncbi:MAG: PD-(D/E)XK nuclease family protein [Chloroflexi bacterium]|nr:PD-(D/E)XK nuclease family protein [Chloroflexota bacterium]
MIISGKDLGAYASNMFCARCEWLRLHAKPLPFQTFPGIFSSIDRYNKRIVDSHFAREGLPSWLAPLGRVSELIDPPNYRKFSIVDAATGVTLRGEADGILRMEDGSYTIIDYKTARYTAGQESMFEIYEAQVNSYAYIAERLGLNPVRQLALVYMEPVTDDTAASDPAKVDLEGFSMAFKATIVPVQAKQETIIPQLLNKAATIERLTTPPEGRSGCRDCKSLSRLLALARGKDEHAT